MLHNYFAIECKVPLFNALFLSNRWKYHHKLYTAKIRFFGLRYCRRQHGSNFNHFDVILASKATEFGEITQTNDYHAVQGHWRLKSFHEKPVCDFLCVSNSYLLSCTVSDIWRIIGSIFAVDRVVPSFNVLVRSEDPNLGWGHLTSRNYHRSIVRLKFEVYFNILNRVGNRQTNRQTLW